MKLATWLFLLGAVLINISYTTTRSDTECSKVSSLVLNRSQLLLTFGKHARRRLHMLPRPPLKPTNCALMYISFVLLCTASDIELNPGPDSKSEETSLNESSTAYLCGACKEPVTWNDKGVMCEDCDTWFHAACQNIHDSTYERLGDSKAEWTCLVCSGPNYSSVLFDLHNVQSEQWLPSEHDSSCISIDSISSQTLAQPRFTSSPTKARPKPPSGSRPLRIT